MYKPLDSISNTRGKQAFKVSVGFMGIIPETRSSCNFGKILESLPMNPIIKPETCLSTDNHTQPIALSHKKALETSYLKPQKLSWESCQESYGCAVNSVLVDAFEA